MTTRLPAGGVTVMCAFVLFGFGFALLARLGDASPLFAAQAERYPGIAAVFKLVRLSAVAGAVALVGNGLPIAALALRRALSDVQAPMPRAFAVALLSAAAIA